jgi:Na+:H+ antiporter
MVHGPAFPAFLLATASQADNIPLAMLLVFGSAKLLAELFEHARQPGIVGEILAGVLLGPSVLGWIHPGPMLSTLAELGVLFLLFRVGLEVKPGDLLGVGKTASVVAFLGIAVPLLLGWGLMRGWGYSQIESIFTGTAMVATSVGITAQVLASKGLLDHAASKIILAAAVIDDVLGLVVLAVVSSLARGEINVTELVVTAVSAIGFTVVVAKWGTRAFGTVVPRLEERMKAGEVQFNLAMIALFGLALLAMYAGVAAIIGAFLAGMALSGSLQPRVHHLAQGVSELLLPFFLAGIGLYLDVSVFTHAGTLLLSFVILVAAILSKLLGCGLGALNMGRANAFRVGAGMAPRGEVGMVVAQIGQGLGVISPIAYAVVVFMAVATTMIAPQLLSLSFRGAHPSRATEMPPII